MENEPSINTSYSEPNNDLPLIKTIKCEFNPEDESVHSQLSYVDSPQARITEEGNLVSEDSAIQTIELSVQKESEDVISKGLRGLFKCIRCSFCCTSTKDLIIHYQKYRETEPYKCFQCGYNGISRKDFRQHSVGHLNKVHFRCSKCPFKTRNVSEIKDHVQGHPKDTTIKCDSYRCPLCDKTVATKLNLKLHLSKCKGVKSVARGLEDEEDRDISEIKEEPDEKSIHTCPQCFFIFGTKGKLEKHIQSVHIKRKDADDRIHLQNITSVTSDSDSEVYSNFQVDSDMNPSVMLERIYLCPLCHYVFTSVSSLNKHIVTHKNVTECPICKYDCETNQELKQHIATHISEGSKHLCNICDMKFPTLGKLKYHIKEEHSRKFQCPYCPRTIKTENALRLHIEAHSKVKEFYCPKCSFTATNSSLLQFHMSKYHPTRKRFNCEYCYKSYKFKYSLQRHLENCPGKDYMFDIEKKVDDPEIEIDISQKDKLSCSECKASFKQPHHLKKHLLVHFHSTPFRCLKCGLRCKTKHNLTKHMTVHNIKANYECKVCHKKFKHRHALNNHSITHKDERPFTCEVCGLRFKRKANYRRHYDIHSDVKPFQCHLCEFTARRKDGLQKHLEVHQKGNL